MKKALGEIKKHLLTAISYMLPLVVASGLLIAVGNLMGGEVVTDLSKMTVPSAFTSLGVLGMGLLPSFIGGYISYSIADRSGIAPGFLMGQIASFLGAGFLGGMIGGFVAGYIALAIRKYVKVPKWAEALMPMMIIPTLTAMIGGLLMYFVLGGPITAMTNGLNNFVTGLDQSQKTLYGFIIGFIGCIDFGGAISKVPNLICDGLLLDGITEPEAIKVAFPMGLCMISEGVIPIAMNDLLRTVASTSIGCGVCGAISFTFGVGSKVPSGGVFVIPAMSNPFIAVVALLAGSCVTAILLNVLKKKLTDEEYAGGSVEEEADVDLSGISFE